MHNLQQTSSHMLGSSLNETAALSPHAARMGQLWGKQHRQRGGEIRGSGTKQGMYTTTTLLSLSLRQRQEVGTGALAASLIGILQHKWEGK